MTTKIPLVQDLIKRTATEHEAKLREPTNAAALPLRNNQNQEKIKKKTKPFELVQ